jgi:hypothetical protein
MSIVLAKFGKFPFEHFIWGQMLMYYNRVSTVIKYYILGKAWEAQLAMLVARKKCWVGKNGYLGISPMRWQVFSLRFNYH